MIDVAPEYAKKRVLILGCGNVLFGDDGFGPATVEHMQENCIIPSDAHVMDVGTGAGRILFALALSEEKPEKIIILDAVDLKRKPGEVFEIAIEDIPESPVHDFTFHLFPTTTLLKELRDAGGIDVIILACQVEKMPGLVDLGLSGAVKKSVPKAAEIALRLAKSGLEERNIQASN